MEHKIIKKGNFIVVGKMIETSEKREQQFQDILNFWDESFENNYCSILSKHRSELGVMGLNFGRNKETGRIKYMIGIEKPKENLEIDDLKEVTIPSSSWAVFKGKGKLPDKMIKLYKRIYNEWLPSVGYQHTRNPEIEKYSACPGTREEERFEIWIPVI